MTTLWNKIKSIFSKRMEGESFFNFLLRQFYFSDSRGIPSMHITVMIFVMAIIGYMAFIEGQMAVSITTIQKDSTVITQMRGFSSEFIYLMITMATVITAFFSSREKRNSGVAGNPLIQGIMAKGKGKLDAAVSFVKGVTDSVTTQTTTAPTAEKPDDEEVLGEGDEPEEHGTNPAEDLPKKK